MGKCSQRLKGNATLAVSDNRSVAKIELHAKGTPRSNLIDELISARKAERHSVRSLAAAAGVTSNAIRNLEDGKGPIATLIAVLDALPFQVAGLAPGRTFSEQLRNRRAKRGVSLDTLATRTSLSPREIVKLEKGEGSVENLLRWLAFIAPQVSRHKRERTYWKLGDKVDRDSRFTPDAFMQSVYRAFGDVNLDPCAHPMSPVIAHRYFFLDKGDDGLTRPWSGRLAFVNPPFSQQLIWLQRAHHEWKVGNVKTIVCLVPTRTDSAFFHDTIAAEADLHLLRGRVRFSDPAGTSQVTPFSLMVIAFGATAQQNKRFAAQVRGFWISAGRNVAIAACDSTRSVASDIPHKPGENLSITFQYDTVHSGCCPQNPRTYSVSCS